MVQENSEKAHQNIKLMKKGIHPLQKCFGILTRALVVAAFLFCAFPAMSQTTPVLTVASVGTNQMSVTISNNIGMSLYHLEWTPLLANANYPWAFAAIGVPGGTNFVVGTKGYPAAFYRVILDTNTVPIWQSANPGNPASPILKVTIASPANGTTLN